MSDPVTNVELDDVLSSIRRLVSDRDPAPRPVLPFPNEAAVAEEGAAAPAFLLTPALRVEGEAPRPLTLLFPARPAAEPARSDDAAPEAGLVARLAARLEAAVRQEAEEYEPDGSEDDPVIDWSAPMLGEPPVFRSRQAAPAAPGPVRMILPLADADNDLDAPLREAIEAGAPAPTPAEPAPAFHHRSEIAVPPPLTAPADDAQAGLADDLARASSDLRGDGAPLSLALADGRLLDEEMLRSLVTEILRQELQGTLGERITRNVRKLVRREIFKVLSSQELE